MANGSRLTTPGPLEVRNAARAFNTMRERIRKLAQRADTSILAAVSHDLRTPITPVSGCAPNWRTILSSGT